MKTKKLLSAVEEGTQTAVELVSPYLEQALRDGSDFAEQTYAKVRPVIKDATIRGARIAADTFEKVQPSIDDALDKVSPAVDATVNRVRPAVDEALGKIPPTVDLARSRVQDELLPSVAAQLRLLAAQPLAEELKVAVASAALASQLEKATKPKKRSGWKTFGKIVLAGAVLGGVVLAVKKLLADPSTGWETHIPRDAAYVADPAESAEDEVTGPAEYEVAEPDVEESAAQEAPASQTPEATAEPTEGGDADPLADSPYGPGSYVGDEPPEGYLIKGNDRSKKFHVPGSAAYERTIAEVWFETEEAAEAAGFVKAQR